MSKLGSTKRCGVCGGKAVLRIVQPQFATLGWVDGGSVSHEIPALPMWQCEDCDDQLLLNGEMED